MCILFIAIKQHPLYPLIIAANRDEFNARPTQASMFWEKHPSVLAGRDLTAGGSWMGINTKGDIAALTNIRAPNEERQISTSRGELVINYLISDNNSAQYLHQLQSARLDYSGYNLLFGNLTNLQVYNSFEDVSYTLEKGVYGLSNASLNSPWPKIDAGRNALANYCRNADILSFEHLFELLGNRQPAKDEELPQTGISFEWEKMLSSIFIQSTDYGTRSSTILLLDNKSQVYWEERTFSPNAELVNTSIHELNV